MALSVLAQELVKAGCERRVLNDTFRVRSPLRGADVRWVRAPMKLSSSPAFPKLFVGFF